jgi:hypothetical protein
MTKTQAIKILAKLLGPKFAYREDPRALLADARPLPADVQAAKVAADNVQVALIARELELKKADAKYQALLADRKDALEVYRTLENLAHARRITVGRSGSMFFSVMGEGDSWAEVVAIVEKDLAD